MTRRDQVRQFLRNTLERKQDVEPFGDGESLVLSGRLESVDVVEILGFLEQTYGFAMEPSQFDQSLFDSVDNIVTLLSNTPG